MLTVASPNTDRSLLTLAELRAAAGATDASQDATLVPLGAYVAAMITSACNVARAGSTPATLRLETVTEAFRVQSWIADTTLTRTSIWSDGRLVPALPLVRRPVAAVVSVTEAGGTLTSSDYEVDANQIYRIAATLRVHWQRREIVVNYSAGWATVPDDLKYAAIKFVQDETARGSRDRYLRSRVVPGVLEQQWWVDPSRDSMVPPEVMAILDAGGYINKTGWIGL